MRIHKILQVGLEPTSPNGHRILLGGLAGSPVCLPISPLERILDTSFAPDNVTSCDNCSKEAGI